MPRAEPSETRASQTNNTVRVEQHAPCNSENQRTRLADTPRAEDPCDAQQRTRSVPRPVLSYFLSCTVRAADPCAEERICTPLARSVLMTCAAPFLLLPGALHTHRRSSHPELNCNFTKTQSLSRFPQLFHQFSLETHQNPN